MLSILLMRFGTMMWKQQNYFRHHKIWLNENINVESKVSEYEGINGLSKTIFGLGYRNVMDVKHLLNYFSENDVMMESPTD